MSESDSTKEPSETNSKDEILSEFMKGFESGPTKRTKQSGEYQVERILKEKSLNPFDILELNYEVTDTEIKKKFRELSLQIHPDKCEHKKASSAFHKMEEAYKQLLDVDQRRIYIRVMREAQERVSYEREKENERRQQNGIEQLPDDTMNFEVTHMCKKLFTEIEEKKQIFQRIETNARKRAREIVEREDQMLKIATEEKGKWEATRDDRVDNWRKFTSKQKKLSRKGKLKRIEIKHPMTKTEQRREEAPNADGRKMGMNDGYKRQWK